MTEVGRLVGGTSPGGYDKIRGVRDRYHDRSRSRELADPHGKDGYGRVRGATDKNIRGDRQDHGP